jgi:hypothetical protein
MKKQETKIGYHFTRGGKLRDGKPVPKKKTWLRVEGRIIPCSWGLHMGECVKDALQYAPGTRLHKVELRGDLQHHEGDKWVGRERKILATVEAADLLMVFARKCVALGLSCYTPNFLPADLEGLKQFLQTGDLVWLELCKGLRSRFSSMSIEENRPGYDDIKHATLRMVRAAWLAKIPEEQSYYVSCLASATDYVVYALRGRDGGNRPIRAQLSEELTKLAEEEFAKQKKK